MFFDLVCYPPSSPQGPSLVCPVFMVVFYLHCACSGRPWLHLSHFRHVCCLPRQTCLLCDTGDMSAVSHSRHVFCVTQQACLLCHAAGMSAVSHGRHFCCVTQQACPAVLHSRHVCRVHSRHVCCVTQQTCLLCYTADMSAVSHSWMSLKSNCFSRLRRTAKYHRLVIKVKS